MSLRHPIARARGLGSAKGGTEHFWVQRLTSVALAILVPWFIWTSVSLFGSDHGTVRATLAQPLEATLMLAFVIALFWHAKLGLQVVIEDYIHVKWLEISLQIVITFVFFLAALAAVMAIARIVFAA
jgi:succinate dehydrogenase / fumarate reductase, membrane anchor subunit